MTDATATTKSAARKAECSRCGGDRNCEILGEHLEAYADDDAFQEYIAWYILKCRRCDYVFIQTVSTNSEDYESFYEEDGSTGAFYKGSINYWPALTKRKRPDSLMKGLIEVDLKKFDPLIAAMLEVYGALENDLHMLAAIGIRTTYDIASELLGIEASLTFKAKLTALVNLGLIGKLDRDRLETMVDVGSASAHRGWRPTPTDLSTMMDVLEHFIEESFIGPERRKKLDAEAARVKKTVPPRAQKKRARRKPRATINGRHDGTIKAR
jgi:uncharacterized protein DUF4145